MGFVAGPPATAAGAGIPARACEMSEPSETRTRKEEKELPCREPVGAAWRKPANCQEP